MERLHGKRERDRVSQGTIIYKQVINIMNQLNIIDFNESGLTTQLFITFIWGLYLLLL